MVGSGPAGLSCAYFSARLGHGVTVFEATRVPAACFAGLYLSIVCRRPPPLGNRTSSLGRRDTPLQHPIRA